MTRIAVVEKGKCNPGECGFICQRFCPMNRSGKECIIKGEDGKPVIDEAICSGCGICPNKCPFKAIHIINLPEELTEKPIHQYGQNGFRLYNLPIPIFGKVVGILGKNGIGKSTALEVLAGVLKPNMGEPDKESNAKELIEYFKGSEAQIFFEKVLNKEIKISYKPQAVDLIPRKYKGTVKELLEKVDEKKQLKKIVKELEIEEVLDTKVNEVSGGELQRVAIAACVLKKANLYVFDEPSSYLDIKQRIKVSRFIRKLADEKTAVLVVEHDLIILDYMTDLIHLMYGQESCYGISSMPKTTRAGINVYLSGFLKDENVRFRPYEIKFLSKPPVDNKQLQSIVSWKNVEKKLGKFNLTAKEGSLYKHNVVGVLGANGIGKTSFVKILAGELKQDKGEIDEKIKVAYKPQYINADSEELVAAVLKEAIQKHEVQLIRPLDIKPLMMKKLNELSGGELQRVMVALCLSRDAELFLLDEPSAYLDVEQRLNVSKVIKERAEISGKSILVVDHDLLFIDYLSDNLTVFSGKPAVKGEVKGPFTMEAGMNNFLTDLGITLRRDQESRRPRINKTGSRMDREQKEKSKLYYG
ncbi:MAG: ribosome biogenesis/translation initiation ATPase RLI [bacterium]|nr:ribosome biogenesis/translation initiation ATPase RLI [bacterium]